MTQHATLLIAAPAADAVGALVMARGDDGSPAAWSWYGSSGWAVLHVPAGRRLRVHMTTEASADVGQLLAGDAAELRHDGTVAALTADAARWLAIREMTPAQRRRHEMAALLEAADPDLDRSAPLTEMTQRLADLGLTMPALLTITLGDATTDPTGAAKWAIHPEMPTIAAGGVTYASGYGVDPGDRLITSDVIVDTLNAAGTSTVELTPTEATLAGDGDGVRYRFTHGPHAELAAQPYVRFAMPAAPARLEDLVPAVDGHGIAGTSLAVQHDGVPVTAAAHALNLAGAGIADVSLDPPDSSTVRVQIDGGQARGVYDPAEPRPAAAAGNVGWIWVGPDGPEVVAANPGAVPRVTSRAATTADLEALVSTDAGWVAGGAWLIDPPDPDTVDGDFAHSGHTPGDVFYVARRRQVDLYQADAAGNLGLPAASLTSPRLVDGAAATTGAGDVFTSAGDYRAVLTWTRAEWVWEQPENDHHIRAARLGLADGDQRISLVLDRQGQLGPVRALSPRLPAPVDSTARAAADAAQGAADSAAAAAAAALGRADAAQTTADDAYNAAALTGQELTLTRGDGTTTALTLPSGSGRTLEQLQDAVAAMLDAGDNITLEYDDDAGTLTIAGITIPGWVNGPPDMDDTYLLWSDADPVAWVPIGDARSTLGILSQSQVRSLAAGQVIFWARTGNSELVPRDRLGAGTADATKLLRGDGMWADIPSGSGRTLEQLQDAVAAMLTGNSEITYDDSAGTLEVDFPASAITRVFHGAGLTPNRGADIIDSFSLPAVTNGERVDFYAIWSDSSQLDTDSGASLGAVWLSVSSAGVLTANSHGTFTEAAGGHRNLNQNVTDVTIRGDHPIYVQGASWVAFTSLSEVRLYLHRPGSSANSDVQEFDLDVYMVRTRAAAAGGGLDAEEVRDVVGAALAAGDSIAITVDDAADTITVANTAPGVTDYDDLNDIPVHRVGRFENVVFADYPVGSRLQDNRGHQALMEEELVAGTDRVVNVERVPVTGNFQGAVNEAPTSQAIQANAGHWWLVRAWMLDGSAPFAVVDANGSLESRPHPPISGAVWVGSYRSTDAADADPHIDTHSYMAIPPSDAADYELYRVDAATFIAGSPAHTVQRLNPVDATDALLARISQLEAGIRRYGTPVESPAAGYAPAAGYIETAEHGLGRIPDGIEAYMECVAAEHGYAVGDRVVAPEDQWGVGYFLTSTLVGLGRAGGRTQRIRGRDPGSPGSTQDATSTSWKIVVRPYLDR